jgi:hypothetical protein
MNIHSLMTVRFDSCNIFWIMGSRWIIFRHVQKGFKNLISVNIAYKFATSRILKNLLLSRWWLQNWFFSFNKCDGNTVYLSGDVLTFFSYWKWYIVHVLVYYVLQWIFCLNSHLIWNKHENVMCHCVFCKFEQYKYY